LEYSPRNREEVSKALAQLRLAEVQTKIQRDLAIERGDFPTMYLMESERVGARIAINSILWTLGLIGNVMDSGTVADYNMSQENE